MGKKSTATKNAWNEKAYDQVRLVVKKGQKALIQQYAEEQGLSINGFINKLIADEMGDRLKIDK